MMRELSLTGLWIGSTREEAISHYWHIVQRSNDSVGIFITLDEQPVPVYFHTAIIVADTLRIQSQPQVDAIYLDREHFVVPHWDGEGDMLFSREGLAEMSVPFAWARYDEMTKRRTQL